MIPGMAELQAWVATAARVAGVDVDPDDRRAVADHLALLLSLADAVGEVDPEPAPVFRP